MSVYEIDCACLICGGFIAAGTEHACPGSPKVEPFLHSCPDVTLALRDLTVAVRELKAAVEAKL